jgi:hypothetical protein
MILTKTMDGEWHAIYRIGARSFLGYAPSRKEAFALLCELLFDHCCRTGETYPAGKLNKLDRTRRKI